LAYSEIMQGGGKEKKGGGAEKGGGKRKGLRQGSVDFKKRGLWRELGVSRGAQNGEARH